MASAEARHLEPGTPVTVAMAKWPDRPHWTFRCRWLGRDEHGAWVGTRAGTRHERPGLAFDAAVDSVTLVPADQAAWLATFHAPGIWCDLYVDVATPGTWEPLTHGATHRTGEEPGRHPVLRSVDLDLDVVRRPDGSVYVDDEDEFAEHRVRLGYPDALVQLAERSCASVHAAVLAGGAPFDAATAARWLERLRALSPR